MYSATASSFDEWSAIAETGFVPLRVQPPGGRPAAFRGELVGRGLDARLDVSRITADPCRMTRSGSLDDAPDTLFLSIQAGGSVRVSQAGGSPGPSPVRPCSTAAATGCRWCASSRPPASPSR
nr:hypothetical protein [Pseudonocardia sp. AL041005-10]